MRPGTAGFVGARLTEGRQARQLTQSDLSTQLGVSEQAISQYEKGHISPSPQVMKRLQALLDLPALFFLHPREPQEIEPLFGGVRRQATASARRRAVHHLRWLMDISDYLQRHLDLPPVSCLAYPPGPEPGELAGEAIEKAAAALRQVLRLGDGPIGDVLYELEAHGAVVSRLDLAAPGLSAFSTWRGGEGRSYLLVQADQSALAAHQGVAHHLGHLLLHRELPRSHWDGKAQSRRLEAQASAFASALLLPSKAVKVHRGRLGLDDVVALTWQWGVPVETILGRGQTLGILGEDEARQLWQTYRRRETQGPAPWPSAFSGEAPRILREALERLLETGVQSRAQVRHALTLLPEEIEALVGTPRGVLQDPPLAELVRLKSPA